MGIGGDSKPVGKVNVAGATETTRTITVFFTGAD